MNRNEYGQIILGVSHELRDYKLDQEHAIYTVESSTVLTRYHDLSEEFLNHFFNLAALKDPDTELQNYLSKTFRKELEAQMFTPITKLLYTLVGMSDIFERRRTVDLILKLLKFKTEDTYVNFDSPPWRKSPPEQERDTGRDLRSPQETSSPTDGDD